jgi:hypothetical protein
MTLQIDDMLTRAEGRKVLMLQIVVVVVVVWGGV